MESIFNDRRLRFRGILGVVAVGAVSAMLAGMPLIPSRTSAAPPAASGREHSEQHDATEHAKEAGTLKSAFDGPVDLYFDPAQLSAAKPGISGAKFVDIVDVTGKALLRFEKDGERWLIDPDAIIAFRISKLK